MFMGLIGVPVSFALYWVMLRGKKDDPFPKWGLLRLVIAGVISMVAASLLSMPISGVLAFIQAGTVTDLGGLIQIIKTDPEVLQEMIEKSNNTEAAKFFWRFIGMFFSAGLLEEGLKYLTCRIAIRKEGMVRTWMDAVIAFAFVGITFELLENIFFGAGADLETTIIRSLSPAHFVFDIIMGYLFGKYLVTGEKKYSWLALIIPTVYHTVSNTLVHYPYISIAIVISYGVLAVLIVIKVIRWQKNKTLDVPVIIDPSGHRLQTQS